MIYDYYGTPVIKVSTLIAIITTAVIFGVAGFILGHAVGVAHFIHGVCQ
jgi:hypothetical protein